MSPPLPTRADAQPLRGELVAQQVSVRYAGSETAAIGGVDFRIPAGTTVIWVNDEQAKHTASADDGSFDSGDQALGVRFEHTFTEPGTYPYYCRYHGDVGGVGMAGTVVVE